MTRSIGRRDRESRRAADSRLELFEANGQFVPNESVDPTEIERMALAEALFLQRLAESDLRL